MKKDQRFMVDKDLISRICSYADIKKGDVVLEIGAGTGNLAAVILGKAGFLYAIEKDPSLCSMLKERFPNVKNLEIIHGDAMKIDFPDFDKTVSNVPYSISRKLTVKLLLHGFETAVLVYQKEFARKLLAKTGGEGYRFIGALAQSTSSIEILEDIHPSAFEPVPNVWSSVVRIKPHLKPDESYITVLSELFSHKRKKIRNILKDTPDKWCERRPSETEPGELLELYKNLISVR